ncbi:MAG TPA: NAD(+) kinase [Eubacterium sp.]|nr:NAD(+)/NADH kinase [Lachnospiraceae bacterium]HAZ90519.1 NAD(+) kinase [Eubacterium sp.]
MNSFYILMNRSKNDRITLAHEIKDYIQSLGKKCMIQDDDQKLEGTKYRYSNADLIPEDVDCVIVLGGDGTMIQAARDLYNRNLPLFGVNIGTLGFLTDIEKDNIYQSIISLIKDEYEIDSRMMLYGQVYRDGEMIYDNIALNDIVINRHGTLRVIDFDIYVNGEYLNSYSADGMIVSTATGSTAYSLSAGGPIVQPNASLMMITPVCPHTLNKRSIILDQDDIIEVVMSDNKGLAEERVSSFDGELYVRLITGDKIIIRKAEKRADLVKTSKLSFLQILKKKMSNN